MAIKRCPEDFVVEEVLHAAWTESITPRPAAFAVYRLRKYSLTTPEAVGRLASRFNLPVADVAYAGLKDKQGVTTQHVTVRIPAGRTGAPPRTIELPDLTAEFLGYAPEPIAAPAIAANRFDILIRTLTQKDLATISARISLLSLPTPNPQPLTPNPSLLSVNYFGEQRFGSARTNAGEFGGFIAPLLIRGRFEEALRLAIATPNRNDAVHVKLFKRIAAEHWGDWPAILRQTSQWRIAERTAVEHMAGSPADYRAAFATLPYLFQQMCVDAYQSLMWNEIAHRFIEQRFAGHLVTALDKFGELSFPEAAAVPPELLDMDLPILGHGSPLLEPWKSAAQSLFDEHQMDTGFLSIPGLDRPKFRQVPRPLFFRATDFSMAPTERDEMQPKAPRHKLLLHFQLPRGSYATTLLRALGS
jgi:tRNA pseudouridine13 synthase